MAYGIYINNNSNRNIRFEVIKNGKHGFSKKIDKIAIEILKEFMTLWKEQLTNLERRCNYGVLL